MKYLAFDIEISRSLPEGLQDWKAVRPLGISCAATLTDDGEMKTWYSTTDQGEPAFQMNGNDLGNLVDYLKNSTQEGYSILTWNGLGFDFDILAEESGRLDDCREIAINHVDMMFHFFCMKGYGLGLNKAAQGMGLAGKTEGMRGDLAPKYWQEKKYDEVLEYVQQDVRTTLDLARAVDAEGAIKWKANSGRDMNVRIRGGWLTAKESLKLNVPDTSWMREPWERSKFTGWLNN